MRAGPDHIAVGEEALSPRVDQKVISAFSYQEVAWPHVTMQFGGLTALSDVNFDINKGEIFGLIGGVMLFLGLSVSAYLAYVRLFAYQSIANLAFGTRFNSRETVFGAERSTVFAAFISEAVLLGVVAFDSGAYPQLISGGGR